MTVSFLGHRDSPQSIGDRLERVLVSVIEQNNSVIFYVGNQGDFDRIVRQTLMKLKKQYYKIEIFSILAYMPTKKTEEPFETIFPEGIESVFPGGAIAYRNSWMVHQSDMVICYVTRSKGGAAKFSALAKKKGKVVINLAEMQ